MVIKIIWRAIGMGWNAQERDQILMAVWDNLSYNLFNLFNTTIMGGEESMYTHKLYSFINWNNVFSYLFTGDTSELMALIQRWKMIQLTSPRWTYFSVPP